MPSVILRVLLAALLNSAPVVAFADNAPDTPVVTGPNFQQVPSTQMLVTPSGGSQTTLGAALSASSGNVTGPGSSTVNNIAVFNATTGKVIKDAGSSTATANVVNAKNAAGYQLNGSPLISVNNVADSSATLVMGPGAAPNLDPGANFSMFFGTGAGANFVGSGSNEDICFGNGACANLGTGSVHDDGFGVFALHYENSGVQDTALGCDVMRNSTGVSSSTGVGCRAFLNYFGQNSIALGLGSLTGGAGAIQLGGTITTGDVITITFTAAVLPGGVENVNYTVVSGDTTLNLLSQHLAAAINSDANLIAADIREGQDVNASPAAIDITYHGTAVITPTLVLTSNVTGAATETVTISPGANANATYNNAIGFEAMFGYFMTSASNNNAFGRYSLANLTTGSHNNCMGDLSCQSATTANDITAAGDNVANGITTGHNDVFIGDSVGKGCTNCRSVTAIGSNADNNTIASNNDLILISDGSACTVTSGSVNWMQMCGAGGIFFKESGTNTAATAIGYFSGSLFIGATGTLTSSAIGNGELGFKEVTASGTAPGAGNGKLTVVAGTNVGTCKLIMYAGSSTTPVTVVDNVGAGC